MLHLAWKITLRGGMLALKIGFIAATASLMMTAVCGHIDAKSGTKVGWVLGAALGTLAAPFIQLGRIEGESWRESQAKERTGSLSRIAELGAGQSWKTFWHAPRMILGFCFAWIAGWLALVSTALAYCPILPFHWPSHSELGNSMALWPVGGFIIGFLLGCLLCKIVED